MLIPFNALPKDARVWVYQSKHELTDSQVASVTEKLKTFVGVWQRHGEDLKASFAIKYNQFIILAVDENVNDVSGCSIDSSVHCIKQLEEEFGLDLMNKLNIAFKIGAQINTVSMIEFQSFVKSKKVNEKTIVFNNMIQSKTELETSWEVPANLSWHQRFF